MVILILELAKIDCALVKWAGFVMSHIFKGFGL